MGLDNQVQRARQEADAISAIRTIARHFANPEAVRNEPASDHSDAVCEVAAWGRLMIREALAAGGTATMLQAVAQTGLPEPLLTSIGVRHNEVAWTNYIFRVLGGAPLGFEATGNALAKALFASFAGVSADTCDVEVFRELSLGAHHCECGDGSHGCSLDLALLGPGHAVAIEHKVKSPPSDFRYGGCEHPGKQTDAYIALFKAWCEPRAVVPHFVWLAPATAHRPGWECKSHEELASILAPAVAHLSTFGDRYRASAFLMDLSASVVSDFSLTLSLIERFHHNPEDDATAAALAHLLGKSNHHLILAGVLHALSEG